MEPIERAAESTAASGWSAAEPAVKRAAESTAASGWSAAEPAVKRAAESTAGDAIEVLRRALAGEGAAVAGALDAVVDRAGVAGAYHVAWRLAAATVGRDLAPGTWRLDFPDIEHAPYEARWVARFLSAYANADATSGAALFRAAQADGQLSECLRTLAGSAAATLRRVAHRRDSYR